MGELGVKLPNYKASSYEIYDKIKDREEENTNNTNELNPVERKLLQDIKIVESVALELIELDSENKYGDEAYKRYKVLLIAKNKLDELMNNSSDYSMAFRDKLYNITGKVNKIVNRCKFLEKGKQTNPRSFMQKEATVVKNPFDDLNEEDTKNVNFNPFDDFSCKNSNKMQKKADIVFNKKAKGVENTSNLRDLDFGLKETEKKKNVIVSHLPDKSDLVENMFEDFNLKDTNKGNVDQENKKEHRNDKNELLDIDPNKPSANFDVDLI